MRRQWNEYEVTVPQLYNKDIFDAYLTKPDAAILGQSDFQRSSAHWRVLILTVTCMEKQVNCR